MAMELAKAYVQIVPSAKGIKGSISSALGDESKSAGKSAGLDIAGAIKGAIAAAGIGTIIKETLDAGGNLQQSFGGLDTLYGDASKAAKEYAYQAAQAGISANTYAEQAVSFGAALKASLGDEKLAAEAANTAILDMADNSAKMGTDIGAIQNAYQGFAKGNYTMLDNLKLGYGGTKTEMERLLADAEKLSGVKYDIDNLGDVYGAIHVVQEELGLTGVAAQEASETFSGSFNAMKASVENLMADIALGNDISGDIESLIGNIVAFVKNNLIPMLMNIVQSIPSILGDLLKQSGYDSIVELSAGIGESLPNVVESIMTIVSNILTTIIENFPEILAKGVEIVKNLAEGIWKSDKIIFEKMTEVLKTALKVIAEHLPTILEKGIELIGKLAAGIIRGIPDLISQLPEIFTKIKEALDSYDWATLGHNILEGIKNGITAAAHLIKDAALDAARSAFDGVKSFFGINSPSRLMADEVGRFIPAGVAVGIEDNMQPLTVAMSDMTDTAAGYGGSVATAAGYHYGATATSNSGDVLNRILGMLDTYLPMAGQNNIVLDTGVLVGSTVAAYDSALGKRQTMKARTI